MRLLISLSWLTLDMYAEKETLNSTKRAQTNKDAEPEPVSSTTGKGSAIRRVTLVVSFFFISTVLLIQLRVSSTRGHNILIWFRFSLQCFLELALP